jgi:hypothetical protein
MSVIEAFFRDKRSRVQNKGRMFQVWVRDPQELEFTDIGEFMIFAAPGPVTLDMADEAVQIALGRSSRSEDATAQWDPPTMAPWSLEPGSEFVEFTVRITEYDELLGWLHFRMAEIS